MYIRLFNKNKNDLIWDVGRQRSELPGNRNTYVDIGFYSTLTLYYKEDVASGEYIRYYREVDLKIIKHADLYVDFVDHRIVLENKPSDSEEVFIKI